MAVLGPLGLLDQEEVVAVAPDQIQILVEQQPEPLILAVVAVVAVVAVRSVVTAQQAAPVSSS